MENIKQWYLDSFPEDELGQTLRDDITFEGLFEALDNYQDVYVFLFGDPMGGDSVIRERIFEALAEIIEVPYEEVYDQWLMAYNEAYDLEVMEEEVLLPKNDAMESVSNFEDRIEDHRRADIDTVEMMLETFFNKSALTFEGLTIDSIPDALEFFIEEKGQEEAFANIFSGAQFNEVFRLSDRNVYPEDLAIIVFENTGTVLAISVGARWLDDIVNNNAEREGYHPFDPAFADGRYDDDYAEIGQDFDDLGNMMESYILEEGTLTEDTKNQKVREAVALIQQLPSEQEKKALDMLRDLNNVVLDTDALEPAFMVINKEATPEQRERLFLKHLRPNVRERILQAAVLILDKPDFSGFTILKALEFIKKNKKIIDKIAEVAGEDFAAEVGESLVDALEEAHQGTGMDRIGIHETIYDAFMAEGFPFVSDDKVNNVIGRVRYRVKKEINSKYEIVDIDLGEVGYARLSREAKERIEKIIREEVKEEVDRLKGKRPGTPSKFAKHRGGFPGTAKKTK